MAGAIVDRQAEEIVSLAVVALRRLGLLEEETPVVLGVGCWRPGMRGWTDIYGSCWPHGSRRRSPGW
ncbi:hypothetical protein SHKM778_79810 [Streptomyces sp. KM77-8]|uniref:Uncharacterized protein n=1 Tax=Streptomyces haneummycinicus TaxID=3074435 RepID=A0AAT9HVE6_9ACTN